MKRLRRISRDAIPCCFESPKLHWIDPACFATWAAIVNGLPLFWPLRGRLVVIVGDGPAAAAKASLVAKSGARLLLMAADPSAELRVVVGQTGARLIERPWRSSDIRDAALVFGGDLDPTEADRLSHVARRFGVPVNIVDQPALSDFYTPAIVDRGDVVVGISTSGSAPVLAQRLRQRIEACLPHGIGRLAAFAGRFRQAVRHRFPDGADRRRFWSAFFDSDLAADVMAGGGAASRRAMIRRIRRWSDAGTSAPAVTELVLRSNDPQDMTLRDLARLSRADVILYPAAAAVVAGYGRRDAEKIEFDWRQPVPVDRLQRRLDAGADIVSLIPASSDSIYQTHPTYHGEVR